MVRNILREPNFALLVALAWLILLIQLMAENWAALAATLPDADDAMRLVQVRALLAGQGWFDLHETRLGLAAGYDTHWSRLIDAGLAALFFAFKPLVGSALAERLMAALWPVLWLIPATGGIAAIAWRFAGREAAILVLLLAIFNTPGLQQFRPGRIDHHNAHIALSVLIVAATVWSDRHRWTAGAAGALTGFAIAIGFESLPFIALCGGVLVLRFVLDRAAAPALGAYAMALVISTWLAFFVSVAPERWPQSLCDAIAINSALALIIGGIGFGIAASFAAERLVVRCAMTATSAVAALCVFAAFDLRCLGGPYALIDPAIRPIWLDDVAETLPLSRMLQEAPVTAFAMVSFPLIGLLSALMMLGQRDLRKDFGICTAGVAFLLAFGMMLMVNRAFSYAIWLGMPFVAAAALRAFARLRFNSVMPRFVAALLITPTAVTGGVIAIANAAGTQGLLDLNSPTRQACVRKDNYAALAELPVGRVVVDELEWGPYVLAWTPHALLAAPYHRLSPAIVAAYQVFALPPEQARAIVRREGVTYVMTCGAQPPRALSDEQRAASLWVRLRAGDVPDWLEPIPGTRAPAVFRVKD